MLKNTLPLLLVFSGSLQAAIVTQVIDFSTSKAISSGTNIQYSVTDDLSNESAYEINQFDATLGTLTQINITIRGELGFSANAGYRDNNSFSDTGGEQITQNLGWSFSDPFQSSFPTALSLPTRRNVCSDTSSFDDASCQTQIQLSTSDKDILFIQGYGVSENILETAVGTGTVSLLINQAGSLRTTEFEGEDGFVDYRSASYRSDGTVVVEYLYDVAAVPVPAAAWLFGSALIGLAGIKRKK